MARGMCAAVLVGLALMAGCGDDDDGDDPGTPSAQSAPTETTEPETTATTEPDAAGGAAPDRAGLESCLSDAKLELKDKDEPFTDAKGKTKTREDIDMEGAATYAGYVQWPSKSVADIYLAKDQAGAEKAEEEAATFIRAFGFDPAKYVRRAGSVVMTFDDPPPSDEEVADVERCAGD